MRLPAIDSGVLKDPGWRHWAVTIPLLAASLAGFAWALPAAIALCGAMALHFFARLRAIRPFPVQVRLAYLLWLAVGMLPGMRWMHGVALARTTAMVLTGYCPLARLLSLLWFNRTERLTQPTLARILFSASDGGLFRWTSEIQLAPVGCCSIRRAAGFIPAVCPSPTICAAESSPRMSPQC